MTAPTHRVSKQLSAGLIPHYNDTIYLFIWTFPVSLHFTVVVFQLQVLLSQDRCSSDQELELRYYAHIEVRHWTRSYEDSDTDPWSRPLRSQVLSLSCDFWCPRCAHSSLIASLNLQPRYNSSIEPASYFHRLDHWVPRVQTSNIQALRREVEFAQTHCPTERWSANAPKWETRSLDVWAWSSNNGIRRLFGPECPVQCLQVAQSNHFGIRYGRFYSMWVYVSILAKTVQLGRWDDCYVRST